MLPRERIEQNEHLILSEFACRADMSKGRAVYEKPCELRTDFQRDRDRIIHCNSFRRLKHKTQVFLVPLGDHYRTRLTHTLEVSQISRTVARALGLNEDLTEAIALGHDLGHTPFGHDGERMLGTLVSGGFRHNLQGRRVCEKIEKDGRGLNLTYEVLDGICGHTGDKLPETREGMVVRYCDKIAYINHDIEDAVRGGVITQDMLPDFPVKVLGKTKSARIASLVNSLVKNSGAEIKMDFTTQKAHDELREFMFEKVYRASKTVSEKDKASYIVEYLFKYFFNNKDKLPRLYLDISERDGLETAVSDFISGMTDEYAIDYFTALCVPKSWKSGYIGN
ncbi:MAG: deoxyguanosinetriphosphate triphosphohydrolase [Oscillospiraceae bacterium]|nr:deoxyguanosinetriphosphate triphosphohydrolase [Oscillospiraceae bacterium]